MPLQAAWDVMNVDRTLMVVQVPLRFAAISFITRSMSLIASIRLMRT